MVLTVSTNIEGELEIESVSIGEAELTEDVDYTLDDLEVTLLTAKLDTLEIGVYEVTIETTLGEAVAEVGVVDTTEEV